MDDLKVSVIVPVYKVEQYLDRCVGSIVGQTYCNLDIILIDDGSTDISGVICDELAKNDGRIRVIHQDNMGLSGARNTGLDLAYGDFIVCVDSDDIIDKTFPFNCMCDFREVGFHTCSLPCRKNHCF